MVILCPSAPLFTQPLLLAADEAAGSNSIGSVHEECRCAAAKTSCTCMHCSQVAACGLAILSCIAIHERRRVRFCHRCGQQHHRQPAAAGRSPSLAGGQAAGGVTLCVCSAGRHRNDAPGKVCTICGPLHCSAPTSNAWFQGAAGLPLA